MPATEKDLAEDAPWKRIQQNTFTRWCNEHLKCVQKRVGNLQTDLGDGLRLIALLEVLSQKQMGRKYNARPTFRQMQLENVSVALEFLERENIKLVSIDSKAIVDRNLKLILGLIWIRNVPNVPSVPNTANSKAIVDGNLKLILGLIWTLILHYSISMPMWDEEDEEEAKRQTPKQRLLGWIQNRLPQLPITNFSKDWQSGRALGALVDSCAPGATNLSQVPPACPSPVPGATSPIPGATNLSQVITPEEIVDPNVDEHSVMTYLSQFPKAKLKPGAPLRPKLNPKKARAYGPGAGPGEVGVSIVDPSGRRGTPEALLEDRGSGGFRCSYRPQSEGLHLVHVTFGGVPIPRSPFSVTVGQ
ncbi:Filamin-A, partial [Lonchura striata]